MDISVVAATTGQTSAGMVVRLVQRVSEGEYETLDLTESNDWRPAFGASRRMKWRCSRGRELGHGGSDAQEKLVWEERMTLKLITQGNRAKSLLVNITASHTEVKRLIADAEAGVKKLGRPSSVMLHAGSFGRKSGALSEWPGVHCDGWVLKLKDMC